MKQNKFATRISVFALSATFAVSAFVSFEGFGGFVSNNLTVVAEEYDGYFHGLGDEPIDYYSNPSDEQICQGNNDLDYYTNVNLPDNVDLSESPYFPPIGDQMGMGSCVAWATTYYQFTYEVNKLNNITTDANNACSPAWIFNLWNGGSDNGSVNTVAYDLLKTHGSVRMEDAPYQTTNGDSYAISSNFDYSWCTDTNAMVDALNTRLSGHDVVTIPSIGTPITNNGSASLKEVKELLYGTDGTDGKILNIRVLIGDNWSYANRNIYNSETGIAENYISSKTGNTEEVVYRASNGGGGHAMTVVGYDDNVWCDINCNNIVDAAELGAFKVANSWSSDWRNEGYIWVSYDALNKVSAVPGDWESSKTGTRISIFDRGISINGNGPANGFYYIDVQNEDVYYVGQLTMDTNYRNSLNISAGRNLSSNANANNLSSKFSSQGNTLTEFSHVGTLVFDYDDLAEPIGDYISGYNWFVRLNGNHNNASFKITDNLSNTIVDFGSISTGDSYMPISLSMGDLNYDGVVNSVDTEILYNARNNGTALSNLQEYLATNMDTPIQDYTVDYIVAADWGTGRNIQITITNTGDVAIRNWALQCSNFEGDISNPWNCTLLGDDIIKNAMYNSDIAVGQSVTFGYTLTNATGEIPVFSLCTFRSAKQNGYDVSLDVISEWDSGFIGNITITNTTNEPIMAWELSFTAVDFTITGGGQFEILENSGNNYTITGTYNGNIPIPANTSITMQFNGTKNGTPALSNVSMTEMVIEN